jgi:hypothetical protein
MSDALQHDSASDLIMVGDAVWPAPNAAAPFSRAVEVEFDEDLANAGTITPYAAKCPVCMVKTNAWDENEARVFAAMHNVSAHGIPMPPVVRCD